MLVTIQAAQPGLLPDIMQGMVRHTNRCAAPVCRAGGDNVVWGPVVQANA